MGLQERSMFSRLAALRAPAARRLCTATGELQVYRPKIKKTTTLSPFEMEVITPADKYFKKQGAAFVENVGDWLPSVAIFCLTMHFGSYYHDKWAREHAIHGDDEE